MTANEILVSLRNVGLIKNNKVLVNDINFDIKNGDIISLIGPNGAGKSTLVKLLLGFLEPSCGQVIRKSSLVIGYVPQKFQISPILPLQVINLLQQARKNRLSGVQIEQIYNALDIIPLLQSSVATLSGGELQRVLLAYALLDKPDLLVLDEPMQGLDPEAQNQLYDLIDALPPFLSCAMLVVSHDLHWVMRGTKRVICLNKHICCQGVPADIANLPEFITLFGAEFGQNHNIAPYVHHHNDCQHGK